MVKITASKITKDVVVTLDYSLEVDGNQIDSGPTQFIQGYENIIPGLERELEGLDLGEEKEVMVSAKDAYGLYNLDMEIELALSSFPKDFEIKLGRSMRLQDDKGNIFTGVAIAITDQMVKLNLNHPLAGKDLLFKTMVKALRQATEEEIEQGHLASACNGCNHGDCSDCA
ncbi:MAG: peptidylprolyl isomerase [Chloroflexota bacterium]|nr:peptidylprolyl isomerase [Chloroflexota bacterium]